MYAYLKALHIIFVVTWFAGLFYLPRLFIYNTEAGTQPSADVRNALQAQFILMSRRLLFGIIWPSAVLTLVTGVLVLFLGNWDSILFHPEGRWLLLKLLFVFFLFLYHLSLHRIFRQQEKGLHRYSSNQLRIWNEVATIFLVAIVMLVVVKQSLSFIWGMAGLFLFILLLMAAIRLYKLVREGKGG